MQFYAAKTGYKRMFVEIKSEFWGCFPDFLHYKIDFMPQLVTFWP